MIYHCERIGKIRDWTVEKGDLGYIEDKDLPEQITKFSFLLNQVILWEEYYDIEGVPFYKDNKPKIRVYFKDESAIIFYGKYKDFTKVIEDFYNDIKTFKNN